MVPFSRHKKTPLPARLPNAAGGRSFRVKNLVENSRNSLREFCSRPPQRSLGSGARNVRSNADVDVTEREQIAFHHGNYANMDESVCNLHRGLARCESRGKMRDPCDQPLSQLRLVP